MAQEHPSKTTRMIGSILRKVFDLEPEVLDAFLQQEDVEPQRSGLGSQQGGKSPTRAGFAFETTDTPFASAVPLHDLSGSMMLDGRGEHERWQASSDDVETEVEDRIPTIDPSTSPLFSNNKLLKVRRHRTPRRCVLLKQRYFSVDLLLHVALARMLSWNLPRWKRSRRS